MSRIAAMFLLGAWSAAAAEPPAWSPGPIAQGAATDAVDLAIARFPTPVVATVGPDSLVLEAPTGRRVFPGGGIALRAGDLDADEVDELVVCGAEGLTVLTLQEGVPVPTVLATTPCAGLELLNDTVVAVLGDELVAFAGKKVGSRTKLADAAGSLALATGEARVGVLLADGLLVRQSGQVRIERIPADTIGMAADGPGWAFATGGESPALALADGTRIPLPAPPVALQHPRLGTTTDLIAGVAGSLALRSGRGPVELHPVPHPLVRLAVGDLDADGCPDVAGLSADGRALRITGTCRTAPEPSPPAEVAADPMDALEGDLPLGETWATFVIRPGQTANLRLTDAVGEGRTFTTRAGPARMTLSDDGLLRYAPTREDIGVWRTPIAIHEGSESRWTGVVIQVRDDREQMAVDAVMPPTTVDRPVTPSGPFAVQQCFAAVGAEVGVSANRRQDWSSVGLPDAVPSASPSIAVTCSGGGEQLHWFLGVDSAPAFFYLAPGGRMNHLLGGTIGFERRSEKVRIGTFANAGLLLFGVGARAMVLPFTGNQGGQHGFVARATLWPANAAASVTLGYAVEFGRF